MSDRPEDIVDPATSACMTHGRPCCGHHDDCLVATLAVSDDGSTSAWVLPRGATSDDDGWWTPPHERTGPLPQAIAQRLTRDDDRREAT